MRMNSHTKELEDLSKMQDSDIDFSDIPEVINFSNAVRGKFYRPIKQSVTLRLDADIIEWFKTNNPKYQTAINKVLRSFIVAHN